jgi:hypothetical protein
MICNEPGLSSWLRNGGGDSGADHQCEEDAEVLGEEHDNGQTQNSMMKDRCWV